MEQREKLIELLEQCNKEYPGTFKNLHFELAYVADKLLANGVVVLPCKVGDTVYEIITCHDCTHPYCYSCGDAEEMSQKITCEYHKIRTTIVEREFKYTMIDEVGDSIFTTREEAEEALAKRKGDIK